VGGGSIWKIGVCIDIGCLLSGTKNHMDLKIWSSMYLKIPKTRVLIYE